MNKYLLILICIVSNTTIVNANVFDTIGFHISADTLPELKKLKSIEFMPIGWGGIALFDRNNFDEELLQTFNINFSDISLLSLRFSGALNLTNTLQVSMIHHTVFSIQISATAFRA